MATPQLSPGVIVREVDLTAGRADNVLDNIGAICGPFPIGPVDEPYLIRTQQELINVFGKPLSTDRQYEYWMSASSFLSYGGILKVVRTSGSNLNNANAGVNTAADSTLLIQNKDNYELNYEDSTDFTYSTRNPGEWGNNLKVCFIDNVSDQTLGISTTNLAAAGIEVGFAVTAARTNLTIPGDGTTSTFNGQLKGIVTGIKTDSVNGNSTFDVKVLERIAPDSTLETLQATTQLTVAIDQSNLPTTRVFVASTATAEVGDVLTFPAEASNALAVLGNYNSNPIVAIGDTYFDTQAGVGTEFNVLDTTLSLGIDNAQVTAGIRTVYVSSVTGIQTGDLYTGSGLTNEPVTAIGGTFVNFGTTATGAGAGLGTDATVGAAVTFNRAGLGTGSDVQILSVTTQAGAVTPVTYTELNPAASFSQGDGVFFQNSSQASTGSDTVASAADWYDLQTLGLTNSTIFWKSIAARPVTSNYTDSRDGTNDSLHIAVVDDTGDVTGVQGNILEKSLFLSKAKDATADGENPTKTYYKDWITKNSDWIFAGSNPSSAPDTYWDTTPTAVGFSTNNTPVTTGAGLWGQDAQGVTFSGIGNVTYNLSMGKDYGASGGMVATLGDLNTSYRLFTNKDDETVDYLIMGPGLAAESDSQAKANLLISLAEGRKDCIATISPDRANVVNVTSSATQTQNVLQFYAPVSSSSYAILDSGWKYMFDRFNNKFVYVPCNGDTAGLCVRTTEESYPWFSPAGLQRGVLNNAVKLAYNPDKDQRDLLYGSRINPIVTKRGAGTLLFGDKTALGYASAFDRINVRRLFLTVEQALEGASEAILFEINDALTRANFVNIVEPYLRDVQAKRGIYDFQVVCDETNNTPAVVDNNEFRADIFLQPTKSVNFITLTFVATRTGIDFSEVVGTV